MTIDEHFYYMLLLEGLIFFAGILLMRYGQRQQMKQIDQIINNPEYAAAVITNMFDAVVKRMSEDEGFAKRVGSLFVYFGQCALGEIRELVGGKIKIKPPKNMTEALGQLAQGLFAMPDLQQALANKAKKAIGAEAVEAAETVIDGGKWL